MVTVAATDLADNIRRKYNNDLIDRLNHIYSALAFVTFAFIFLFETIFDTPVVCLTNGYEIPDWIKYMNSYCYIENKYFVSPNQTAFPIVEGRRAISVDFYPWIVVILVLQGIFFALPHWMWESFNPKTGIPLRSLAIGLNTAKPEKIYGKNPRGLDFSSPNCVPIFLGALKFNNSAKRIFCCISPRTYLSKLYLLYKFANCVNALGQLMFLNFFLVTHYTSFSGTNILFDYITFKEWVFSGHFPRLIFCDFIRRDEITGTPFQSTVQCLLPFNMLYESMFVASLFWISIVAVLNLCSFVAEFWFIYRYRSRAAFIEKLLSPHGIDRKNANFYPFVENILGKDGVTTLRILFANSTHYQVSSFANDLFEASFDQTSDDDNVADAATTKEAEPVTKLEE